MDIVVLGPLILLSFYIANGQLVNLSNVFTPSELVNANNITNNSEKLALRYGFHQTSECNNYEKAFLCIQKCIDKGYNLAYSDKYCFCTCYLKKEKAKYTPARQSNKTRWKLGIPKTTKPAWIQKLANQSKTLEYVIVSKKKKGNTTNILGATNITENIVNDSKNKTNNSNETDVNNIQNDSKNTTASDIMGNSTILTDNQNLTSVANTTVGAEEDLAGDKNATANEKLSSGVNKTENINVANQTDVQKESNTTNVTGNDTINITNTNNTQI